MAAERIHFTCVCLQKTLVLGNREEARKKQIEKLHDFVQTAALDGESVVLPGGCIVVQGGSPGEGAGLAAAFIGQLENYAALVKSFKSDELSSNLTEAANQSNAEFVCHLYRVYGRVLPQKLKGDFAFVLFDPVQERVLAAASPTSNTQLLQARGADNSLIITTKQSSELPKGSHTLIPIPAGYLKYGWSSDPQRYAISREHCHATSRAMAVEAARTALSGLVESEKEAAGATGNVQNPRQSFADSEASEPPSPLPKKTRRGKRAGRNQKLRAEQISLGCRSTDLGRPSLDFSTLGTLQSASSFSSRADEQSWWRTNTPRASLDLRKTSSQLPGTPSSPFRRASMSAAAPSFVPSQPGLFTRQSVPAVKSQSSALHLGPPTSPANTTILLPSTASAYGAADSHPRASPFQTVQPDESKPGKADAAWSEESDSSSTPVSRAVTGQGSDTVFSDVKRKASQGAVTHELAAPHWSKSSSLHSISTGSRSGSPAAGKQAPPPRVKPGSQSSQLSSNDEPRGASPGGSPHRPPRVPNRGPFKQFFKAMMTKRPSHVDLKAEADRGAAVRSRVRSSSHSNLVDLERPFGFGDAPHSATSSGSEGLGPAPQRHNTPTKTPSRQGSGDVPALALQRLQLGEDPSFLSRNPAAWIAKRTRSIFSKSKSCTDLGEMERPAALQSPTMSDVEVN